MIPLKRFCELKAESIGAEPPESFGTASRSALQLASRRSGEQPTADSLLVGTLGPSSARPGELEVTDVAGHGGRVDVTGAHQRKGPSSDAMARYALCVS